MVQVLLLVCALAIGAAAGARPIEYRCPENFPGDDRRPLERIERLTSTWRVDEPVPFVVGLGRYWRLVCSYQDPSSPTGEMEAVAHWVSDSHEDGRLILKDVCAEAAPSDVPADTPNDVLLRSTDRQATASATRGDSPANVRLARQMLDAVEASAAPCPWAEDAPLICPRWRVSEKFQDDRIRVCIWRQGEEGGTFRYIYSYECRFEGFMNQGEGRRTAPGVLERTRKIVDGRSSGRTIRFVYTGDFESNRRHQGSFRWILPDGNQGNPLPYTAECLAPEDEDWGG